jgi:hypothetical protein
MRRNIISLGEDVITGEIGRIFAAGEMILKDADVNKLTGAGEINIEDSYVSETKLAGEITARNSSFGSIKIAGVFVSAGICKAETMVAVGEINAEELECKILRNFSENFSGVVMNDSNHNDSKFNFDININKFKYKNKVEYGHDSKNNNTVKGNGGSKYSGKIKAETFENLCDFTLDFDYNFKNILNLDILRDVKVVECNEFYNLGVLDLEGISAEIVYILPTCGTRVNQIMGCNIVIDKEFIMKDNYMKLPRSIDMKLINKAPIQEVGRIKVDSIEGDNITIDYVEAKFIRGDNVIIGKNCIIDKVEYRDEIEISDSAIVKEVIQLNSI